MLKKIIALSIVFSLNATALEVKKETPYTVKDGDTLWGISSHFFKDPWKWENIWGENSNVDDPDLIHPGDVVILSYENGNPILKIQKNKVVKVQKNKVVKVQKNKVVKTKENKVVKVQKNKVVKTKENKVVKTKENKVIEVQKNKVVKTIYLGQKKPKIKTEKISNEIPPVNYKKIIEFDKRVSASSEDLNIVVVKSYDDVLLNHNGDKIFISSDEELKVGDYLYVLKQSETISLDKTYKTYKSEEFKRTYKKKKIEEQESKKLDIYNNTGVVEVLEKSGDVYLSKIVKSIEAIRVGDSLSKRKIFDKEKEIIPTKPIKGIKGRVLYIDDRINGNKENVVILDVGEDEGIVEGNVLSVSSETLTTEVKGKDYKINGINKGYIFVYKVAKEYSYGIIVNNKELIKIGDSIKSPF